MFPRFGIGSRSGDAGPGHGAAQCFNDVVFGFRCFKYSKFKVEGDLVGTWCLTTNLDGFSLQPWFITTSTRVDGNYNYSLMVVIKQQTYSRCGLSVLSSI